jgi:hypothetical protein
MFDNDDADEVCAASILAIWFDFFVCWYCGPKMVLCFTPLPVFWSNLHKPF